MLLITPCTRFHRQRELELSLDKILAVTDAPFVYSFLDLLDEYIINYNKSLEDQNTYFSTHKYSDTDIVRLLNKYDRIMLRSYGNKDFSSEQRLHFNSLKEYVSELYNRFIGRRVYLTDILIELNKLLKTAQNSKEDLLTLIREHNWLAKRISNFRWKDANLYLRTKLEEANIWIIYEANKFSLENNFLHNTILVADPHVRLDQINAWSKLPNVKNIYNKDKDILVGVMPSIQRAVNYLYQLQQAYKKFTQHLTSSALNIIDLELNRIKDIVIKLEYIEEYLPRNQYKTTFDLTTVGREIKLLRQSIMRLDGENRYNYDMLPREQGEISRIKQVTITTLNILINQLDTSINFDNNLIFSLDQIKQNSTLYLTSNNEKKSVENSLGEENLSGIVATTLRGIHLNNTYISVCTEQALGCGRSDITIKSHNKIIGHVEFKMIKKTHPVAAKTQEALHQLFHRYSENDGIEDQSQQGLYLVLFTHDKQFRFFAKQIQDATIEYAKNNNYTYEVANSNKRENRFSFYLTEPREDLEFANKVRLINVILCNLEVDHQTSKKQATNNKPYVPGANKSE